MDYLYQLIACRNLYNIGYRAKELRDLPTQQAENQYLFQVGAGEVQKCGQ